MKKIISLTLLAVMALTLLTGCSNPVYDDFSNFLNVEMAEVNENYEAIKAEAGTWDSLADDAAIKKSIDEVLLPLVNDSLTKLEAITPATEEVTEIKAKYVKVMEAYKAGFEALSEGCETQDEATINAGNDALTNGLALLDEYNAALEELAAEVGAEIEY